MDSAASGCESLIPVPSEALVNVADRAGYRMSNALRYRKSDDPAQTYMTPEYALGPIRADLGGGIDLDPCTIAENPTGAASFFTLAEDGLARPWDAERIFVNPPYGKAREPWVHRCIEAASTGSRVVLLIPAATDTRIWQLAAESASAIVFVKGRLKFGVLRPNRRQLAASHASTIFGWNTALVATSALGVRWIKPMERAA